MALLSAACASGRARTYDPPIKSRQHYHLCYEGKVVSPRVELGRPSSGAPGFEPGAATNFATRPCARERRWPCSRVAFHCGVSPDRSCPVGSRNGSRSRATVSPVRARASRDEAGIRCLRGILLLCMGGRTRTLNRRFWRPLRYLLRHAHRWLSGNEKPPLTAGAVGGGFASSRHRNVA